MSDTSNDPLDPLEVHRAAYERLVKAQTETTEALFDLEDARKAVVDHLASELAHIKGIEQRTPVTPGAVPWVPGMVANPIEDPVRAFVDAAEGAYYQSLGRNKPAIPLAIHINNNNTLLGIDCPHCGKHIDAGHDEGTRGR
jgi:hypothetical protein